MASLGSLASPFGSVALPRRPEGFEAWQGAFRQFRKGRKKVGLGSLASPFGSLASPKRRGAFEERRGALKAWQGGMPWQPGFLIWERGSPKAPGRI